MTTLDLKPTQKPIKAYYESLEEFEKHGFSKETSVRDAFADLLKFCARKFGTEGKWTLIPEYTWRLANGNSGAIDGAIVTDLGIVVGYWEAKLGNIYTKTARNNLIPITHNICLS